MLWRAVARRRESRRRVWQVADGFDEPGFFVVELVVVCAICEEIGQEFEEALFVHDEEFLYFVGLVGVCSENLGGRCWVSFVAHAHAGGVNCVTPDLGPQC